MSAEISTVTVIGYEEDLNSVVDKWKLHNDNKTVIGMDENDRTLVLVPRHLCVIKYNYGQEEL